MESNNGEIQKEDIEWLYSAIDTDEKQVIYIFDDSAIATDGSRLHTINSDKLPGNAASANTYINLEPCLTEFYINPEFLVKALCIFGGKVEIKLLGDINGFHGVRISSKINNNVAFVCGMERDRND